MKMQITASIFLLKDWFAGWLDGVTSSISLNRNLVFPRFIEATSGAQVLLLKNGFTLNLTG